MKKIWWVLLGAAAVAIGFAVKRSRGRSEQVVTEPYVPAAPAAA